MRCRHRVAKLLLRHGRVYDRKAWTQAHRRWLSAQSFEQLNSELAFIDNLAAADGLEKQYYRPGTFPDVSTTGNWENVGHYTQVVWRNTTAVGGGLASGHGNTVLVCHYSPAGNVLGQTVF